MRIHYLQHAAFEGLGAIANWVESGPHTLTSTQLYQNEKLPSIAQIDALIIMGGPMSVNDTQEHPWLQAEINFIAQAIEQNKKVLGICLGSQLIAKALGANIYPNEQQEIGWYPLYITGNGMLNKHFSKIDSPITVLHWHGETFDLPKGATHLAFTHNCQNQAFSYGTNTLALQFHLETTPSSLDSMISNCGNNPRTATTQSDTEIRQQSNQMVQTQKILNQLLTEFFTAH
ncbi:MAG: hypothetical protein RIS47_1639 [Bacteroidota bacterium]